MKTCTKCKQEKLLSEFSHKRPTGKKPGLQPRCKSCCVEDTREWVKNNSQRVREWRAEKYGITYKQLLDMFEAQNGKCKICYIDMQLHGNKMEVSGIDHCHKTGKIRGLLCISCNRGLGYFRDNPEFLRSAANYLEN